MHHIRHAPTSFMRLFRIDPAACRRMFDPLDERTGDTAVQYRAEPRPPFAARGGGRTWNGSRFPDRGYYCAGTARGRMTDQPTLGEMFTHHRDRLKTAAWQMAVDGQREGGGPCRAGPTPTPSLTVWPTGCCDRRIPTAPATSPDLHLVSGRASNRGGRRIHAPPGRPARAASTVPARVSTFRPPGGAGV